MVQITFENVFEKVVNNNTISRKQKLNELRKFLKGYSGTNKPSEENEVIMLASLKTIKQSYTLKDAMEREQDKVKEFYF